MTGRAVRVGLVHGLGETPDCWSRLVPLLGTGVRVEAPAMPWAADGAGGAEWPALRDPGSLVTAAFGGALPDVLVAHSFGAGAVLELLAAAGAPPGPRALVLLSPFYRPRLTEVGWWDMVRWREQLDEVIAEGLAARGTPAHLLPHVTGHVAERIGPHAWLRFLEVFLRSPVLEPGRIGVPVTVAVGADDTTVPPDAAEALTAALPDATLAVLPGCGHFPMLQQPALTAALLTPLLAPLPVGGPE